MLGLFCDTFSFWKLMHSVMWSHSLWLLCTKFADTNLTNGALVQEVWLCTEPQEWGGLSLGNLSHKTSRETVHTFCRRFHLSPLLCSVRIQQCQLCDICHPLSLGIVELESKNPHL